MLRLYAPQALRTLSPAKYRISSTSLRQPYQLFSKPLPPPPQWPTQISSSPSQTWTPSSLSQWKECKDDTDTRFALFRFQTKLRSVPKQKKIRWPTEESISSNLSPGEYLTTLLSPIAEICNQLHSPRVLKTPMEFMRIDFSEPICGFTFKAEDFRSTFLDVTAPIILSLPDDLFDSKGRLTGRTEYALSEALKHTPSVPSIIVTNLKDIAVFLPPTRDRPEAGFHRIATTQTSLALRVISAAFLHDMLPYGFIDTPPPDMEVDEGVILPEGPPPGPEPTSAGRSPDRARALQFFRWNKHVQQQYPKLVAHPDDKLAAVTNDIGTIVPEFRPIYPFDPSELPTETAAHLETIQRESPLATAGIAESLEGSKCFTLKIQSVVAEGSTYGICTVYRCLITSVDGKPVSSSPSLCLKLFDDRFQPLQSPCDEDCDDPDMPLPRWFDRVVSAEMYALNEAYAYYKLRSVQGSVVPWFYGYHKFTLPDGTGLYGLLMEYIEGSALNSDIVQGLSPDRQIQMIQSCRHASRVLDVADISQRDWHSGQVLHSTHPATKLDHAVLIDFASTTQTWEPEDLNHLKNYFGLLRVLLGRQGDVGINSELVWKHFGDPDDWDPIKAIIPLVPRGKDQKIVKAGNMFPYILSPSHGKDIWY